VRRIDPVGTVERGVRFNPLTIDPWVQFKPVVRIEPVGMIEPLGRIEPQTH